MRLIEIEARPNAFSDSQAVAGHRVGDRRVVRLSAGRVWIELLAAPGVVGEPSCGEHHASCSFEA